MVVVSSIVDEAYLGVVVVGLNVVTSSVVVEANLGLVVVGSFVVEIE